MAERVRITEKQTGSGSRYLVLAFFLGCWLTGLPTVPFFTDPFLARSLCFSGQPQDARSSVNAPIKLKTLALFLDCFFFFFLNRVSCFHVKIALSKCSLYNTVCHSVANQGYCAVQGHFNMASIRTVPYQPSFDWLFSHKKRKKHQGQQEEVATHTASVRQLVSEVIRQ